MSNDLSAFIDLQPSDARDQWRRVIARHPLVAGVRQERFLPVEVLTCYGLSSFGVVDAHRYGGATAHRAPAQVQILADTFKRSPGSLLSKILNLEGARPNGAKLEFELYKVLVQRPDLFVHAYGVSLAAARAVGLGSDDVPDLAGGLELPLASDLGEDAWDSGEHVGPTSKNREVATRVGQQLFRRKLMLRWEGRCAVTGSDAELFLRASHIQPWAESTDAMRLDPDNGLLLIAGYDAAFDAAFISFDDEGRLIAGPKMTATLAENLGIDLKARLRRKPTARMRAYLELHRARL